MAPVLWGMFVLVVVVFAAFLVAKIYSTLRSRAAEKAREQTERRLKGACREALTIVDLTTIEEVSSGAMPTVSLTAIAGRIDSLDAQLSRLVLASDGGRLTEALAEMRHVALSLEAALDCERTLRVSGETSEPQRSASLNRIGRRSAELDLAVRSVSWLATDSA